MKSKIIGLALAMGLAAPAAATVIDFTADDAISGTVLGINYTVTGDPNGLTNSRHDNNVGCDTPLFGLATGLACTSDGSDFDVGFGVRGSNNNEVDPGEYVQVEFDAPIRITGFAGMLTYRDTDDDFESVIFEYSNDGISFSQIVADASALINAIPADGDTSFDTVGLAAVENINVVASFVRFRAGGQGDADDNTFNVTAAALDVEAIPLPAAGWMLLAGIGGLISMRRLRKTS
jgi:hypothetical protein